MQELPRSSKYVATPRAPLSEDERNRLVAQLNQAYADGVVPADDYPRHLDTLFSATELGQVAEVVRVLPAAPTHDTPAIVPVGNGTPGELTPAASPRPLNVLMAVTIGGVALMALIVVVLLILVL